MRGSRWASPSDSEAATAATGTDGQAAVWSPSRRPTEPVRRSAFLFFTCIVLQLSSMLCVNSLQAGLAPTHAATYVHPRSVPTLVPSSNTMQSEEHSRARTCFLEKHISSCSASTACRDRASDSRCFVCRPLKPCGMRAHALLHARACHDEYASGMGFNVGRPE